MGSGDVRGSFSTADDEYWLFQEMRLFNHSQINSYMLSNFNHRALAVWNEKGLLQEEGRKQEDFSPHESPDARLPRNRHFTALGKGQDLNHVAFLWTLPPHPYQVNALILGGSSMFVSHQAAQHLLLRENQQDIIKNPLLINPLLKRIAALWSFCAFLQKGLLQYRACIQKCFVVVLF